MMLLFLHFIFHIYLLFFTLLYCSIQRRKEVKAKEAEFLATQAALKRERRLKVEKKAREKIRKQKEELIAKKKAHLAKVLKNANRKLAIQVKRTAISKAEKM